MRHIHNYIIKISKEFNETFKTESGLELYGHKDFSYDRLSNRYATIIGQPLLFDGEILEVGTKVLIDPSVYYHSIHGDDDIKQYTTNTINQKEGIYSIEPQNIVLYKKDDTWHGYLNNFLGVCIEDVQDDTVLGGLVVEIGKTVKTDHYNVVYVNDFLENQQVKTGDRLAMKPQMGVSVWIEGKEYTWLRSDDTLAKIEEYV